MKHVFRMVVAVVVLALAQRTPASTPVERLAPFLDAQTIAVVRVDVARLDLGGMEKIFADSIEGLRTPGVDKASARVVVEQTVGGVRRWREGMTAAGAKELFVVLSLADFPNEPAFVVPVEAGADTKAIARFLPYGDVPAKEAGDADPLAFRAEVRDGMMVWAQARLFDRLKAGKPEPRPGLADALAAAGESAAIAVAYVPSADVRRALGEMLPALPREIGGAAVGPVARDVDWASIGVTLGAAPSATVVVRCATPAAAAEVGKAYATTLTAARAWAGRMLQQAPPEVREAAGDLDRLAKALAPAVKGDRVTIALAGDDALRVSAMIAPALAAARHQAAQQMAMSHLRQITLACVMYADSHKGEWPPDLQALVTEKLITPEAIKTQRIGGHDVPFVYVKPADRKQGATIAVYQDLSPIKAPVVVGFVDGHVEMMDRAQLQKALEARKK
ncbi:MAG: hypothetical protein ACAI43_18240 [Phycisphaerae bacterium]